MAVAAPDGGRAGGGGRGGRSPGDCAVGGGGGGRRGGAESERAHQSLKAGVCLVVHPCCVECDVVLFFYIMFVVLFLPQRW